METKANNKKIKVVILTPDNIDFKTKVITRDKERSYSSSISGYFFTENQNTKLKRHIHLYVYCSVIYNSQDIEAT